MRPYTNGELSAMWVIVLFLLAFSVWAMFAANDEGHGRCDCPKQVTEVQK